MLIAIVYGGIGETGLSTILSALNIPSISSQVLKRHVRKVGIAIEEVAKSSCLDALKVEKALTIAHDKYFFLRYPLYL